jgi:hypothetical protein
MKIKGETENRLKMLIFEVKREERQRSKQRDRDQNRERERKKN